MRTYLKDICLAVITVLQSMRVTLHYLLRPSITLQYPDEKWRLPERSRSSLAVDLDICTACKVCQLSCPVECISIDVERDPEDKKKRYMTRFDIDFSKCMLCSLCCDPCPSGAIHMTPIYERVFSSRDEMVSHFIKEGERIKAAAEK